MGLGKIFVLHESSVTAIRNCYNLLVVAAVYLLTILGLALLAIGFGEVMDRLAVFVGLDWKTQLLISYAGRSIFVILIVVSFALALGDVFKLVGYYISEWRSNHEPERPAQEGDQD